MFIPQTTPAPDYHAVRNPDGTFDIFGTPEGDFKNIPYIGEYDHYREMDYNAEYFDRKVYAETGYVCRVTHNKENEFVFFYPVRVEGKFSEYIII